MIYKNSTEGGYIPNPYGRDLGLGYRAYDLLDDIDFYYNKVKCRKIEKLLPVLNKLVIEDRSIFSNGRKLRFYLESMKNKI